MEKVLENLDPIMQYQKVNVKKIINVDFCSIFRRKSI